MPSYLEATGQASTGATSSTRQRNHYWQLPRLHVDATVYVQDVTSHVVAFLYDVADRTGDVFGFAEATERNRLTDILLNLLRNLGNHLGFYKARCHRVDGDVIAGKFLGGCLG